MGSAKGGQEVVDRDFVAQVGDFESCGDAAVAFFVEQVVGADTNVEDMAGVHTARVPFGVCF